MKRAKTIYKRSPKPRYITIRIKYYPLDKRILLVPLFVCLAFLVHYAIKQNVFIPLKNTIAEFLAPSAARPKSLHPLFAYAFATSEFIPTPSPTPLMLPREQVVFHGDRTKKQIALTFDADMTHTMKSLLDEESVTSYYDKRIIDYLIQTQTKATLFLTGMWIEIYQQEAKDLAHNALFELANHSYSHPSFAGDCYGLGEISDSEDEEQFAKTQILLKALSGKDNHLFRFPGGCYSPPDLDSAKKAGLTVIQWDTAGDDGFNEDVVSVENNVIDRVQNGSIIVLHLSGPPNAPRTFDALPTIVEKLKQEGYSFVTVSELFHNDGVLLSSSPVRRPRSFHSLWALDVNPSPLATP